MSDLNFYWRMGDYALEACPKRLARFDEDEVLPIQGKRVQILNRLFLVQHA